MPAWSRAPPVRPVCPAPAGGRAPARAVRVVFAGGATRGLAGTRPPGGRSTAGAGSEGRRPPRGPPARARAPEAAPRDRRSPATPPGRPPPAAAAAPVSRPGSGRVGAHGRLYVTTALRATAPASDGPGPVGPAEQLGASVRGGEGGNPRDLAVALGLPQGIEDVGHGPRPTGVPAESRGTSGPHSARRRTMRGLATDHAVRLERAGLLEGRDPLPQALVVRPAAARPADRRRRPAPCAAGASRRPGHGRPAGPGAPRRRAARGRRRRRPRMAPPRPAAP